MNEDLPIMETRIRDSSICNSRIGESRNINATRTPKTDESVGPNDRLSSVSFESIEMDASAFFMAKRICFARLTYNNVA